MSRIYSIDVMRGIVMVIMVLDHVRDFFHKSSLTQQPTDLATTSPELFFTRWVTHLCAPTFVFLSGVSVFLAMANKANIRNTRNFLLTRGLWLIILDFTVVGFGLWFDTKFNVFLFNVIAAIGFGFIILALLIKLRPKYIGLIGLCIIALHNLFPLIAVTGTGGLKQFIRGFFLSGAFPVSEGKLFVIGYSPIPWLGILLLGFGLGSLFQMEMQKQKSAFLKIGLVAIALFFLLRSINVYGDLFPWTHQKTNMLTFLSFINLTKYPPSLMFCLMFLGIMFLILSLLQGVKNRFSDIMRVYGKVPLFYFITHWYITHPFVFVMLYLQGYKNSDMVFGFNFGRPHGASGVDLWLVYVIWLTTTVIMYPLCKWYGKYKEQNKEMRWLKYI